MFTRKSQKLSKHDEKKVNEEFDSFKYEKFSDEDINNVFENEETIMDKMTDEKLKGFIEYIKLFFCMLKDFATRKYTEVPVGTIIAIVGTLLYILNPIDIIPDFIPLAGYLDDASIIATCIKVIKVDIDKYKEFKELCAWSLRTGTLSKIDFFL